MMKVRALMRILVASLAMVACAVASGPPAKLAPPQPMPRPAEPGAIPLYAGVAPGSERDTQVEAWEQFLDQRIVRNVTRPVLLPVLPDRGKANGGAVIVLPGGGYQFLSIDTEGLLVARRLAARGYTAFVLKYRTAETPAAPADFFAATAAVFGKLGKSTLPDHPPAIADAAAAVRRVRADAAQWGVDPRRVGAIGFSAGARTVIRLVERHSADASADHVGLVYPPMERPVEGGARPPLFLAIAVDDPLFTQGGLSLLERWLAQSRQVEFHLYSAGSHGFGMRQLGTTSDGWIEQYLAWLDRAVPRAAR
jgi:acetyl esterase/lipase